MLKHLLIMVIIASSAIALSTACSSGGGKGCTTLCTEAQAGSCTSVKGDCAKFCTAANNVKGPASCGSQYDSYQSCLNGKPSVCDTQCGSLETALSNCVTQYCLQNQSNADCVALGESF